MSSNNKTSQLVNFSHAQHKISLCPHCGSTENIIYDTHHDLIYCHTCGIVLREGFDDYTPLEFAMFPKTSQENKNKKLRKYNDM